MRATAFAILHTWPELKNAEYEVLQRLLAAAARIDAHPVVIDRHGTVLQAHADLGLEPGKPLPDGVVAFLVSLHFDAPSLVDCHAYIALWNPLEFLHTMGYDRCIENQATYHDLLSCASGIADAHGLNLLEGLGRAPVLPLPTLFHTVPEPFLAPSTDAGSRLFYVGMNFERIGAPRGRFHDLFMTLDRLGMVDIYGPTERFGVAPWRGFACFRGELPFDGWSVQQAANRAGICLALSSAAHKTAGILSNRLFEGLAGGAAVIASPNAVIDRLFAAAVWLVDDSQGEAVLTDQILAAVHAIRADPAEARRRTLEGQRVLRDHCSMERSLQRLIVETPARRAAFERDTLAQADVTVILAPGYGPVALTECVARLARQRMARITLHVVCNNEAELAPSGAVIAIHHHAPGPENASSGPMVDRILQQVETPLFAFLRPNERLFAHHFSAAARALAAQPGAHAACAGSIVETIGDDGSRDRSLASLGAGQASALTSSEADDAPARLVYRAALLQRPRGHLFTLLDGEEPGFFRLSALLEAPLAQTNLVTHLVRNPHTALRQPAPRQPAFRQTAQRIDVQRRAIRDRLEHDPRWADPRHRGLKPSEQPAEAPKPVAIDDGASAPPIAPGQIVGLHTGGDGLCYIVDGLSTPEAGFTWVEKSSGILACSLPASVDLTITWRFVITLGGRPSIRTGRNQHVTLAVNGATIAYAEVPDTAIELAVPIPPALIGPSRRLRIELTPDHVDPVLNDAGQLCDGRLLSFWIRSFGLLPPTTEQPATLRPEAAR